MLRSHDVAYSVEEEHKIKEQHPNGSVSEESERLLLFLTIHEALAFCETGLIHTMGKHNAGLVRNRFSPKFPEKEGTLAFVFSRILGCSMEEERILGKLNGKRYHEEIEYGAGQEIFSTNSHSDAFYVVLKGSSAVAIDPRDPRYDEKSHSHILSGAGIVQHSGSLPDLLDPALQGSMDAKSPLVFASVWPVGGVFGYVDCLLQRPRNFRAVATESGTVVAKITMSDMHQVQNEDPMLDGLIQRVLLQASLLDLANCTCDE